MLSIVSWPLSPHHKNYLLFKTTVPLDPNLCIHPHVVFKINDWIGACWIRDSIGSRQTPLIFVLTSLTWLQALSSASDGLFIQNFSPTVSLGIWALGCSYMGLVCTHITKLFWSQFITWHLQGSVFYTSNRCKF